jgi:putative acetyltransferase
VQIVPERPEYEPAIRRLHLAAFPTHAEADLVDRLRDDGDSVISLVALEGDKVLGHVLFSRMTAPQRALGLAPLAVDAERRGEGVANRMITEALAQARTGRWEAVFVLGDPAYYTRFGFSLQAAAGFETPYAGPHFMALALDGRDMAALGGHLDYAPAFRAL